MKVIHRLVGYDRHTDRMKARYEIPADARGEAKRIAGVASDDPDAVWSYPLSADQSRAIAALIRAQIDPDHLEFFLEPFADSQIGSTAEWSTHPDKNMTVFVLKDENTLVPLEVAEFSTEDDFQTLLSKFPLLLSWEQNDTGITRRWLSLKREKAVPAEDGGAGRWSVDHLFIDQDRVPTLVEVKRQSHTRVRREVVGQMLDYAQMQSFIGQSINYARNSRRVANRGVQSVSKHDRGVGVLSATTSTSLVFR